MANFSSFCNAPMTSFRNFPYTCHLIKGLPQHAWECFLQKETCMRKHSLISWCQPLLFISTCTHLISSHMPPSQRPTSICMIFFFIISCYLCLFLETLITTQTQARTHMTPTEDRIKVAELEDWRSHYGRLAINGNIASY